MIEVKFRFHPVVETQNFASLHCQYVKKSVLSLYAIGVW